MEVNYHLVKDLILEAIKNDKRKIVVINSRQAINPCLEEHLHAASKAASHSLCMALYKKVIILQAYVHDWLTLNFKKIYAETNLS